MFLFLGCDIQKTVANGEDVGCNKPSTRCWMSTTPMPRLKRLNINYERWQMNQGGTWRRPTCNRLPRSRLDPADWTLGPI
jgi:hypothetical protein